MGGFSIVVSTFAFYIWQIFNSPNILVQQEDRVVYIEPGTNWKELIKQFDEDSVVNNMIAFGFAAKFLGYQESIKPGKYLLTGDGNTIEAIRKLRSGEQEDVKITFNNIRFKEELAAKICEGTMADTAVFDSLLGSTEFLKKYDLNPVSVLSVFLPDTYFVRWTNSAEDLFERMVLEYKTFWNETRLNKAKTLGLSPYEVSILASIVESETRMSDEKAKVAGLYINRLKKGMLLQSDPTAVYGYGDFTIKRVLNKHIQYDSPYNTYLYKGLPPGLIRVPTKQGIDAVLNYSSHDYIFMCARPDYSGYHDFAKTSREHTNNANKYRRWLKSEGIR